MSRTVTVDDMTTIGFWQGLGLGTIIVLSDIQTLEDSKNQGKGYVSQDFQVSTIFRIHERHELAHWNLFRLRESPGLWLVVKMVRDKFALRLYFEPDGFKPGNRKQCIEEERAWLFDLPEGRDSWCEIPFTSQIPNDIRDVSGNITKTITYCRKQEGSLSGPCFQLPADKGVQLFATITEYGTADDCPNPELMVTEIGRIGLEEGGLICLLQGCSIGFNDVDVLRR